MKKWLPYLGGVILVLAISDYLAYPILSELMFPDDSIGAIIGREMFMYFLVGIGGVYALGKFPEQLFFAPTEKSKKIAWTLGIGLILANTIFYIISINSFNNQSFIDILQNNLLAAIGISIRTGITEEILFRFFLINSILFVGGGLIKNARTLKIAAIILSAIAFIFIHPASTAMVTLIAGLVLGYVYFEIGLTAAIVIHIFSNLIPFVIISLGLIN